MIQRSGLSARSFLPMSAATSRTCSTFFLSSVSGMVKNCGACGSIAPPITVDIMVVLLPFRRGQAGARPAPLLAETIAQRTAQQGDSFTAETEASNVRPRSRLPPLSYADPYPSAKPTRRPDGRGADNDCLRQLRPHPRDPGRPRQGRGLRGHLSAALSGGDFLPRLPLPGIRRLGAVVLELHPHRRGRHFGLCRHPGLRVAAVPAFRHLRARRRRHPRRRTTCAASASACRNTRSPRWSGCAA